MWECGYSYFSVQNVWCYRNWFLVINLGCLGLRNFHMYYMD